MTTRTEPNVLQTKITTFVLAGLLVTLGILVVTVYNMFPLNRPQIFFLQMKNRTNEDIMVTNNIPKTDTMLSDYKNAFVREYVQHRNEIYQNKNAMEKKWNSDNGAIRTWSDDKVYNAFSKTSAFRKYMGNKTPDKTCVVKILSVQQLTMDIKAQNQERYQVAIENVCTDRFGQTTNTPYKLHIDIATDNTTVKWKNRLENPLGLKVVQYKVVEGGTDPLDME